MVHAIDDRLQRARQQPEKERNALAELLDAGSGESARTTAAQRLEPTAIDQSG